MDTSTIEPVPSRLAPRFRECGAIFECISVTDKREQQMKWQRKKVTIARRDGAKVTTAHVYGGLAVHKPLDDNGRQRGKHYVITHAASGLSMCGHRLMDSLDGAKACVERLHSTGINWALSNGELLAAHKATLKTVPDIIDQFRDYALRRAFRL